MTPLTVTRSTVVADTKPTTLVFVAATGTAAVRISGFLPLPVVAVDSLSSDPLPPPLPFPLPFPLPPLASVPNSSVLAAVATTPSASSAVRKVPEPTVPEGPVGD